MPTLPNKEEFKYKECIVGGDPCWLIIPEDMGTKWFDDNSRFRSCIVRQSDNFVVSQGFGKFVNFSERPEFQPWDESWPIDARHKLDGSLLIVSKYKGEFICRTRGTIDARQLDNGHEIDTLIEKYPWVFGSGFWTLLQKSDTHNVTLLFEWTTPTNIIVLRESEEPTLTLVGAVYNDTCEYFTQDQLDDLAKNTFKVPRPKKYSYKNIYECMLDVEAWVGKEGVVLYSPDGQTLKKIKADLYCELHKLATGIKGVKQVLDVFMASPKFIEEKDFYNYIENTLDFEIAEKCKDYIGQVTEAYGKVVHTRTIIDLEIERYISKYDTRKEQALAITTQWSGWMIPYAFQKLDDKVIDDKIIRIAIESYID